MTVRFSSHGPRLSASESSRRRVQMSRRLVQEHDGSVSQHGTCDGDALAFAGAQGQTPLADRGVETMWQSSRETQERPDCSTARARVLFTGSGVAEAQIVGDGSRGPDRDVAVPRRSGVRHSRSGMSPSSTATHREPAADGATKPSRTARSVVLPDPDSPVTATCSPKVMSRLMPSSTGTARPS